MYSLHKPYHRQPKPVPSLAKAFILLQQSATMLPLHTEITAVIILIKPAISSPWKPNQNSVKMIAERYYLGIRFYRPTSHSLFL